MYIIPILIIAQDTVQLKGKSDKEKIKIYQRWLEKKGLSFNENNKLAQYYLRSAINTKDKTHQIFAYKKLGESYYFDHQYKKAINAYKSGLSLARQIKNWNEIVDINYKLGIVYKDQGDYIKAFQFAQNAFIIRKQKKDNKEFAEILNLLGIIYEKSGYYTKSLGFYHKSLRILLKEGAKKRIANLYNNIGNIYLLIEDYEKAFLNYNHSLELFQDMNFYSSESKEIMMNKAKAYISMGKYYEINLNYTEALTYYKIAYNISKNILDKPGLARSLNFIGNIYNLQEDYLSAENKYLEALKINTSIKKKNGISTVKSNLGTLYIKMNKIEKGLLYLSESFELAKSIGAKDQVKNIAYALYDIYYILYKYHKQNQYLDTSLVYLQTYSEIKENILNEETKDSLMIKLTEIEITSIAEDEITKEKTKNKILFFIILSISTIIALGIMLFYNKIAKLKAINNLKNAEEKKIRYKELIDVQEKERKRIAQDLHDSLGQTLSTTKLHIAGMERLIDKKNIELKEVYQETCNLLDESFRELRNISFFTMSGTLLKKGLIPAIEEIIRRINKSSEIHIVFENTEFDKKLTESIEINLYRIVQEALNNIMKHADASLSKIILKNEEGYINLCIEDNGKGFSESMIYKSKGIGWKNIISRVSLLNGTIQVDTNIGKGTRINIYFYI